MALIGGIETDSGVIANYHIIGAVNWQKFTGISVQVNSYKDEIARQNNKQPVSTVSYFLQDEFTGVLPSMSIVYDCLITLPAFSALISDEM